MSTTTAGTATKEQHYTGILHSALVSGQWKEEPGLGWKEMFRKVRKHRATPANTETDEELVYTLSLLLLSTSSTSCELEENRVNEVPAAHLDASPVRRNLFTRSLRANELIDGQSLLFVCTGEARRVSFNVRVNSEE